MLKKKDLFLFNIDDTIFETTEYIINKYNEIVSSGIYKNESLKFDDYITTNDFTILDNTDLIPIYPNILNNVIEETLLNPYHIPLVKGINTFLKRWVFNHDCLFITQRKYISITENWLAQKLIYPPEPQVIITKNLNQKSEVYLSILQLNHKKYNNIYIIDDNLPSNTPLVPINYGNTHILVRTRPWNKNLFTNYKHTNLKVTYFQDYKDLSHQFFKLALSKYI